MTKLDIYDVQHEPSFQASRWLQIPFLVSATELKILFDEMGEFSIFQLGGVQEVGKGDVNRDRFLSVYAGYVAALQEGKQPNKAQYGLVFSSAITKDPKSLYGIKVAEGKKIIRMRRPVIQIQEHLFDYSQDDQRFRSNVYGTESVTWGLQFTYPQLFKDPQTDQVYNVMKDPSFPNTELFRTFQRWMRGQTQPVPFVVDGKKINAPIRLGKECFEWINNHPQLKQKGISVDVSQNS